MGLHQVHAATLRGLAVLPEHARQGSAVGRMKPYLGYGRVDQFAPRARPDRPHGRRHRGQRAPDLGVDRARPRWRSAAGRAAGALRVRLPARGSAFCAATSSPPCARASTRSPPASRASSPWSASPSGSSGSPEELEHFDPLIDPPPPPAHNSLAIVADGEVQGVYRKCDLPNYGVFDERRYFEPGTEPALIEVDGVRIGLTVCEDIWHPGFPESEEAAAGARLVVNASASPYHRGKGRAREAMVAERARSNGSGLRALQHGGRTGRARLRRRQRRDRPRRRGARPRGAVRARAPALRPARFPPRPRTDGASSARGVPTLAELSSGADRSGPRGAAPRRAAPERGGRGLLRRSSSGCATTSRRTASSTSSWRSPAASTPRWSR